MNTSMRFLVTVLAASMGMVCQAAQASENSAPSITLAPLSSSKVAVSGGIAGCNTAAAVDGIPYWEMPTIAQVEGVHGTASIKIDLTSSGTLAAERIYESSGNASLDLAALKSARMTKFLPQKVGCESVSGSYLYEVDF
jgi:TonB family protein